MSHVLQQPRPAARMAWADAAKGLCILLVVLHHVTGKHYAAALPADLGLLAGPWLAVTTALKPLRMPLFFLLSGFFAASALHRPWRQVAGSKLATPYYLYVLWLLVHGVVFSYEQTLPMNRTRDLGELALDLVYASTGLWYLYALAAYFLVLKVLRPLPPPLVVALAVLVAVAGWVLPIAEVNRASILQSFVFFAVGALFPDLVRRIAEHPGRYTTPRLVLAYVVLVTAAVLLGRGHGALTAVVSLVAVPMAIRLSVALMSWPRVAAVASYVGRRTLPVYVLHVPLLAVLHHVPGTVPSTDLPYLTVAVAAAYPLLVTALLVAVALALPRLLRAVGLGWLFRRPRRERSQDRVRVREDVPLSRAA